MATLARTTRYGAGETRGGNVKNHFLGVFTSRTDSPSNLEISRQIVGNLAETDGFDGAEDVTTASTLPVDQVISETIQCYQRLLDDQGIPFDHIEQDAVNSVVSALQEEGTLESVMKDQLDAVSDYVSRAPGSD